MLGKVSSSFSDMDLLLVKAEGIQKGCVTLEKVSYQHELLYAVLHEGMREVPQEVWRGLAPREEFRVPEGLRGARAESLLSARAHVRDLARSRAGGSAGDPARPGAAPRVHPCFSSSISFT